MATRRLQVVLDIDTGRASARLVQAGKDMRTFGLNTERASSQVRAFGRTANSLNHDLHAPLQRLRDWVLVLGNIRFAIMNVRDIAIGWVAGLLKQAGEVERLTVLMKGLSAETTELGKAQEAKRFLANLSDMSRRTGFDLQTLTDSFVKFKSAGLDPQKYSLQGLSDAVAHFGGNSDVMHRAAIAIQQMAGKGVISMEELRQQLGEAVPQAIGIMARAMGQTVPEFTKAVSKGTVAAKPALEAMLTEMEIIFSGSGQRIANTLFGQLAQTKTNMLQLAADFTGMNNTDGGLFKTSVDGLKELNSLMRSDEGRAFMVGLGAGVNSIAQALMSIIRFTVDWRNEIGALIQAAVALGTVFVGYQMGSWAVNMLRDLYALRGTYVAAFQQMAAASANFGNAVRGQAAADSSATMQRLQTVRMQIAMSETAMVTARAEAAAHRETIAALEARRAAILQILAAQELQVAGNATTTAQINATKQLLIQTDEQLVIAETALTGALGREAIAHGANGVAVQANTIKLRIYAATSAIARTSAILFSSALALLSHPLTAVAGGLLYAAYAAGVFENKANAAADAARNMASAMGTLENAKEVSKRINEIDETLGTNGKGNFFTKGRFMTKAQRDELLAERKKLATEYNSNIGAIQQRDGESGLGGDIVARLQSNRTAWSEHYRKLLNMAGDDGKKRAAVREQYNAQMLRNEQGTIKRLEAARDLAEKQGRKGDVNKLNGALASARQYVAGLGGATDELTASMGDPSGKGAAGAMKGAADQAANLAGNIAKLNAEIGGDKSANLAKFNATLAAGGFKGMSEKVIGLKRQEAALKDALIDSKAGEASTNRYQTLLSQMTGRLAELNDELIDGNGNVAKFNAQLAAGKFEGLPQDQIDKLRAVAEALDVAEGKVKVKKVFDDLKEGLAKATAEADSLWGSFNRGTIEADERLASIRSRFADNIVGLKGEELENAKKQIEGIVDQIQRAENIKMVYDWTQETQQIAESLQGEEIARDLAFQRELQRRQTLLANMKANTDEEKAIKQRATIELANWEVMMRQKVARENETAIVKQARNWAMLGQGIQQMMAQTLSAFVDGLAEADLNIGKFAMNILKQLFKIVLQAIIAYAILSAMGMTNNAQGQKVSFGDFMKGQLGQGFGQAANPANQIGFGKGGDPTLAGVHHDGGMIGSANMSRMVSSALFNGASKYHGGGGLSKLGPKEVPLIGLEGERMLNEEQQRALGRGIAGLANQQAPSVQVNVINNSGQDVEVTHGEPEFNGREMILSVVMEAAQKQGPFRDVLHNAGKGR